MRVCACGCGASLEGRRKDCRHNDSSCRARMTERDSAARKGADEFWAGYHRRKRS